MRVNVEVMPPLSRLARQKGSAGPKEVESRRTGVGCDDELGVRE
jgi:hypothetical protein